MIQKTGEKCKQSGLWKCLEFHDQTIPLSEGETFPPVNHDGQGHAATWELLIPA